jgi:sporulation protein YlmC with PRC-barrel domain
MILRHALLAAMITGIAATANAQTTQPATPGTPPAATTATKDTTAAKDAASPNAADARKLIGRNVKNTNDETVGEIKSVFISPDGKVDSVMVGVGGFLGVGEREVQLAWKDLKVMDNGEKVVVNMSKDELKAMAPYKYKDESWRGKVFSDRGLWSDEKRAANDASTPPMNRTAANPPPPATAPATTPAPARTTADTRPTTEPRTAANTAPATESTGDFNVHGDVSANAVIGAKIRNDNKDTVGTVNDLYLDAKGAITTVVVSVGGFLGVGAKDVAIKWSDIKQGRDGKSLMLTTNLSKDDLKAMPDHTTAERRQPAGKDQAELPK